MHDPNTIPLEELLIYEGDELIVDGSDPSTYITCETVEEIAAALADMAAGVYEDR